jgi:hypothetical protein
MPKESTMTYSQSAKGLTISRARAIQECRSHGADPQEMFNDLGDRETYSATEVLNWLGY